MEERHRHRPYVRLLAMTVLSFVAMYILMYAMVDRLGNVFNSINQVYMAGLMAAPMVLIELALMRSMYPDQRLNIAIGVASVIALIVFFLAIRAQTFVTDRQFLRSMIPHHAGAILMCSKAPIERQDVKQLCETIIKSQDDEIKLMRRMLEQTEGR
jgi:uncharacterized protein (DUF305 family)